MIGHGDEIGLDLADHAVLDLADGDAAQLRDHARDVRYEFATPIASALALGLAIAFVAAAELALIGWFASGGFGPGRFAVAGVNALILFAVTFVEVGAVSFLTSFYSAKPDKADHPLLRR
mgnify:CR=1 FL=1